jgi:hypothetical protein
MSVHRGGRLLWDVMSGEDGQVRVEQMCNTGKGFRLDVSPCTFLSRVLGPDSPFGGCMVLIDYAHEHPHAI